MNNDDLVKRLRRSWDVEKSIMSQTGLWMREREEAAERIEQLVAINEELEAERDAALVALFECVEEIDAYIQQEYPQDHPVHERYRQRDYEANPARIFLRDRPHALVKARAMLAEADLERQTATMKGQNDE